MSKTNLMNANSTWRTAKADTRFWDLASGVIAAKKIEDATRSTTVSYDTVKVLNQGDDLFLEAGNEAFNVGFRGLEALAVKAGAPADYLRRIPADLAAMCLNNGINRNRQNDGLVVGAVENTMRNLDTVTLDRYRYDDLLRKADEFFTPRGYRAPPARPNSDPEVIAMARPATEADVLRNQNAESMGGLSIRVGDMIAPGAIMVSEYGIHCLIVNDSETEIINGHPLTRFVILTDTSIKTGLIDGVCGNLILWGAQNVQTASIRRRKSAQLATGNGTSLERFENLWLPAVTEGNILADKAGLEAATREIAGSKDEAIDMFYGYAKKHNLTALSRKTLTAAYETAETSNRNYGSPRSPWGMVAGLTENSQIGAGSKYMAHRMTIDGQAGQLLNMTTGL